MPLNSNSTLLDFVKMVSLEVIVVSTPNIGTLNHTMLTVNECRSKGILIKGIIVNKMPNQPSQIELNTPSYIEKLTQVPLMGVVPYLERLQYAEETFEKVSNFIRF